MTNPFKTYRIDYLILFSFAGAMVALLLIVTIIAYNSFARELVNSASFYQQTLLMEYSKKIAAQMLLIEQKTLIASREMEIIEYATLPLTAEERRAKFNNIKYILANIKYSTPIIHSFYLYLEEGEEQDLTIPSPVYYKPLSRITNESWVSWMVNQEEFWIGEHIIPTDQGDTPVISFARRLYDRDGAFIGLLVTHIRSSVLKDTMGHLYSDANRYLMDKDGRLLTSMGDVKQVKIASDFTKRMAEQELSGGIREIRPHWLIVGSKFFYADLYMVEVTPWSDVTKGFTRLLYVFLGIGLVAILCVIFLTFYLSRQFTTPIHRLLMAMKTFSLGQPTPLPQDYRNEFGVLFRGYNQLIEKINELVHSLEEQHQRQRVAEIETLQAMINPHFLYNTLDQLNWMAIQSEQHHISHILSLMGKMFRIVLSNGETMITVRDEITHIECYLQIQQIRTNHRFTYELDVADEVRDLYLPKLTLQPFVENAFMHGFNNRKDGHLQVAVRTAEDALLIRIIDNGVGIQDNWESAGRKKSGGYGIRNVRERIHAFFGPSYGCQLSRRPEGGTEVSIRLPLVHEKFNPVRENHVEDRNH